MMKRKLTILLFLLCSAFLGVTQTRTVTGTVTDEAGEPAVAATVRVTGTDIGAVTDVNGDFSISDVPADAETITVSYIGMEPQTVPIEDNMTISLAQSDNTLDDVVVVAYGTQKKESLTGSVSTVRDNVIEDYTNANILKSLDGAIPGLQLSQGAGQPGSGVNIRLRGLGSISASTTPLFVVDGVPYSGAIGAINPNDIADVTILKDASATALYGHRASNGAVLITTKRGKKGSFEVSLNTRAGFNSRSIKDYEMIDDPKDFYLYKWRALRNGYVDAGTALDEANQLASENLIPENGGYNSFGVPDAEVVLPNGQLNPNLGSPLYQDDWEEELFNNNSFRPESNLSIRGGSGKARYYFSLGYIDEKAYYIESNFERLSSRLNVDFDATDWLNTGATVSYSDTDQNNPDQSGSAYSNPFGWIRNIAPIYPVYFYDEQGKPVYNDDGSRRFDLGTAEDGMGVRPYGSFQNPVASTLYDIKNNKRDNVYAQVYADISFLKNFNFRYNYTSETYGLDQIDFDTPLLGDAAQAGGYFVNESIRNQTNTHQQLLTFDKLFDKKHSVTLLVGHESYDENYEFLYGRKQNGLIVDLPFLNNAVEITDLNNGQNQYKVEGYLSRLNYDYDNKYFIQGNFRRDASSIFHPDVRWGNFWGVGAGWRISEENFFSSELINELKLRVSTGETGNDRILFPDNNDRVYQTYLNLYSVQNNDGSIATNQEWRAAEDLTWEKNRDTNLGLETSLFNYRVNLDFDYYRRTTKDLIFNSPVAFSLGEPNTVARNVGDMRNEGVEFNVDGLVLDKDNIKLSLRTNGATIKNEILTIAEEAKDPKGGYFNGRFRVEEGRSYYAINMYEYAGVDPASGQSMWWNYTEHDDGTVTREKTTDFNDLFSLEDRRYTGDVAMPDIYGGFGTTVQYKNSLTLNIDFAYQLGGMGIDNVYQGLMHGGSTGDNSNVHKDMLNAWSEDNPNSDIPRLNTGTQNANATSDRFLIDMSYLNLRNVTLTYNLPESLLQKVSSVNGSFFVTGDNLFLLTKRQGYDPRMSLTGSSVDESNPLRTIAFGLNLNF